jgi:phospholipid-binding lipoprotein MlaA
MTIGVVCILCGCASTEVMMRDNPDPLEGYNRTMFTFNDKVDKAVLKPVARAYKAVTPRIIDDGITNFFANLADIAIAFNDTLQLKFNNAAIDVSRVVFNTTFGLVGFFDVATPMGLTKHDEDFGQTLGYWSGLEGYYLVLPLLGPSSTRDVFGLATDQYALYPLVYVSLPGAATGGMVTLNVIDARADALQFEKAMEEGLIDRYTQIRDAYIQRRRSLVYDGNPPRLRPDFEDLNGNDSQL